MSIVTLGIASALLCALFTNLAFLCKHRGACRAPAVTVRRPLASAVGLFRSPWFAAGMGIALVAWLFHVAAMALAPLSLVQAVIAAGLVWLAVLAERVFGFTLGRRQWAGVLLTGIGLALLAITIPHAGGPSHRYSADVMILFEAGLIAAGALLVFSHRVGAGSERHGLALGAASGLLFGVSDIAIKALTGYGLGFVTSPWVPLAIAASIAAFYASARALQKSEAVPVITVTAIAANMSVIGGGIVVFGDPLASDVLGVLAQVGAFGLLIAAAALIPAPMRVAPRPA